MSDEDDDSAKLMIIDPFYSVDVAQHQDLGVIDDISLHLDSIGCNRSLHLNSSYLVLERLLPPAIKMHATLIERKFDKAAAEMLEEPTIRVSIKLDSEIRLEH